MCRACIKMSEENQGAVKSGGGGITNSKSKKIELCHYFLRGFVFKANIGIVCTVYVQRIPTHGTFDKADEKVS